MPDTIERTRHRLRVDDYFRMGETGILGPEQRTELIDGEIFDMAPIGQDHASVVLRSNHGLMAAVGDRAMVSVQCPIRLGPYSAPEADFALLRPRADFYGTGERPGPADILLLIEVSDSSLRYDRDVKLPLYARAGIAEVWIVDINSRVIGAYREPRDGLYRVATMHSAGDAVAVGLAPEITLRFDQILG